MKQILSRNAMHFPNIFIREFFAFVSPFFTNKKKTHTNSHSTKTNFVSTIFCYFLLRFPVPRVQRRRNNGWCRVLRVRQPDRTKQPLFCFCVRLDGENETQTPPFFPCLSHELWQFDLYPSLNKKKKTPTLEFLDQTASKTIVL